MSECKWLFKVGDRVVVTDDRKGDDGWNSKILGVEGEVVEVDDMDPHIPYRVNLDTPHPYHDDSDDRTFWFTEADLQAVRDA